jgi:hypothetical protein
MIWHLVCTKSTQVVFVFPGVVNAFRLGPEWGEMGFCWKGLACEPLSIYGVLPTSSSVFYATPLAAPELVLANDPSTNNC